MRVVPDWICHLLCGAVPFNPDWICQVLYGEVPLGPPIQLGSKSSLDPMQVHHKRAYKSSLDPIELRHKEGGKSSLDPMELHRRFASEDIVWIPPLWGQAPATLGDWVVGGFFALEDGSGVSTAASGLIRFGKFRQNPDNFSKILKNLQKLGNLLKVFETSCNLRNDLEPPLYNRKLFHRKCHQKLSLSAEKGCAAPVAEERSSRHAMPAARLLFPVRRSSIGSRLAFWAPL